jgi:hypothetical protein
MVPPATDIQAALRVIGRHVRSGSVPNGALAGPLTGRKGSKSLGELGISHDQSSRWQKLADVPEEDFEATSRELTTAYIDGSIVCRLWFRPRAGHHRQAHLCFRGVRLSPFRARTRVEPDPGEGSDRPASAAFLTNDPARPRRIVDCISGTVTPDTVYFEPPVTDRPGMPLP